MTSKAVGQIKAVTPNDTDPVTPEGAQFNYIQAGGAGDIAVKRDGGDVVIITASLVGVMGIVPVGVMTHVMAAGTTATDIYCW